MGLRFDGEQQAKLNFAFSKAPVVGQSSPTSLSTLPAYPKGNNASPRSTLSKPLASLGFLQTAPTFRKNYGALASRSSDIDRDSTILSSLSPSYSQHQSHQQEMSRKLFNESEDIDDASQSSRAPLLVSSSRLPHNNVSNPPSFANSVVSTGSRQGSSMMHERILRMKKLQADQSRSAPRLSNETPSPWTNDQNFTERPHPNSTSLSQPQTDSASRPLNVLPRSHASEPQEQTNFGYPLPLHDPSVLPSRISRSSSTSVTRSRSGSVDLNNRGLPAVLAEALQSVETWNSDNQSMRSTIGQLESNLQAVIAERENLESQNKALEHRLAISKSTAIISLKESAAKLELMKAELDSFKAISTRAVASATGIHQVSSDVSTLKTMSEQALEVVKSFFDQDGNYNFKSSETKELIANLGQELSELSRDGDNKQQVINLLREKLEMTTGELVEQKERADVLEVKQARNAEELHGLVENVYRREDGAARLDTCRQELMTALAHAGNMENQLRASETRNMELSSITKEREEAAKSDIADLKSQVASGTELASVQIQKLSTLEIELHDLSRSYDVLHNQLEQARSDESSLRAKVETLEPYEKEVQTLRIIQAEATCIPDLRSQLHTLLSANSALEARVQTLQSEQTDMARLRGVEGSFLILTESTAELQRKMDVLTASHMAEKEKCAKEATLKEIAESRLDSMTEKFERSINALQEKLHASMSNNQLFEQRLELQSETMERDRVLQSSHCVAKEKELVSLRSSIIEHERRAAADNQRLIQMETLDADYADVRQQLALAVAKCELSQKSVEDLTEAQKTLNSKLSSSAATHSDLQHELAEAQALSQAALDECTRRHEDEKMKIRSELAQATARTDSAREDIERLQSAVITLEAALRNASDAMSTFESRYHAGGQMSKEECEVVQAIMRHCQRSVEEQLAVKGNEIRRRDNTIKALEGRIKSIESLLAKQLDSRAKADASAGIIKRSLIDVNNWLPSSPDGPSAPDTTAASMHDQGTIAPSLLSLDHQPSLPEAVILSTSASTDIHAFSKPQAGLASIGVGLDNNFQYPERSQFTPTARSSMKRRRQVSPENVVRVPNSTISKRVRMSTRSGTTASADQDVITSSGTEGAKATVTGAPKPLHATSKAKGARKLR